MTDLKPLEIELIQLTAQGMGAKEISAKTKVRVSTVTMRLVKLRHKLEIKNLPQLVAWAYDNGVLDGRSKKEV